MSRTYDNTGCTLHGTKYCRMLNMQSCEKCTLQKNDMDDVAKTLDAIEELMPEGGISHFYTGDTCMLCRGENKNPATGYAMTDIGNPEPAHTGRNALGIKTKSAMGSIVTLQLSCCKQCRKRHAAAANRPVLFTLTAGIIMLALLNFTPTAEAISAVGHYMPLLLFVVVVGGTLLVTTLGRKKYIQKHGGATYFNIFDIPGVDELSKKGWFEIAPNKNMSKLIFSSEPLKQGLYTGDEAENI